MSKIILHYNLSEKAQRAELAAGRLSHRARTFELEPTPELARIATIATDGTAKIERYVSRVHYTASPITHEADRVLSDQADACLFLAECQTAVDVEKRRIETARGEREARQAAEVAENSARILAFTADDLWDADGAQLPGVNLCGECSPEASKHRDALHAERQRRVDAARERPEVEARAWAAEHGEAALWSLPLQRAATEGRRVRGDVTRLVTKRVEAAVADAAGALGSIAEYYDIEPRTDVPSSEAYALIDRLAGARDLIERAAALRAADVTIGPICRIDVRPSGSADWRTGVLVEVKYPWLTHEIEYAVVCASEAADLPLGREDEDSDY